MKRLIFSMGTLFLLTLAVSCSENEKDEHDDHEHHAMFQCPMKCEDEKKYEKAGVCPKCNMNLEEMKNHEGEHNH